MSASRAYARREAKKPKRALGDFSVLEMLLAVHAETEKALNVSASGDERDAVWIPKALMTKGEACGGWERMDARCQRKLTTIYAFELPRFVAIEKRLAA